MQTRNEAQRYRASRRHAAARRLTLLALAFLAACGAADEHPTAPQGSRPGEPATAGYGLTSDEAFPALIQQRIDGAGLGYRVVNAGVSGDTSAGGRRRIGWLLRQPVAVLVLALGANDMLRGHSLEVLRENLRAIIADTRAAHPAARTVIAGMRAPANLGQRYVEGFDATFPALARETDSALIPFLLHGVATNAELNQRDGIHPTAAGHRVIAETVWGVLEPLL
jgi:acyl-CoA thioesterase-1